MNDEAIAPLVTMTILSLLAAWVPLLDAIASAWRHCGKDPRYRLRNEEALTALTKTPVREFSV